MNINFFYFYFRPDDDYESKDGANKQKTGSLSRKLPGTCFKSFDIYVEILDIF